MRLAPYNDCELHVLIYRVSQKTELHNHTAKHELQVVNFTGSLLLFSKLLSIFIMTDNEAQALSNTFYGGDIKFLMNSDYLA